MCRHRQLNKVTRKHAYYMPTIDEIVDKVGSSLVVLKLDLTKGYYQVAVAEESKDLTTFTGPFRKFRFRKMPFGLTDAPAVFQQLMDQVLRPCSDCAADYIDDMLVYSNSWEQHMVDLRRVLTQLRKFGLTAKPAKCQFGMAHLEYLGHVIGQGKVAVPEQRVTAMTNYTRPVNKKNMRAFLGTVGYGFHASE